MKIKKRHIVLASMVLALSAAVFLNWQLSSNSVTTKTDSRELGVATYVNRNVTATSDEAVAKNIQIDSDAELSDEQSEYFMNIRVERQKTQDEVISLAKQVLELAESSEEAMEESAEQLSKLEDDLLSQNRIESTLKAKGFSDCLCWIDDSSCTVIVPKEEMNDNSALVIMDCVSKVSDLPFENISIVEK